MDKSLRWRTLFLAALVVWSVLYLLPSAGVAGAWAAGGASTSAVDIIVAGI